MWPPTAEKYDIQRLKSQIADVDFTVFSLGSKSQRSMKNELWYRQQPKDKASHCLITIAVPGMHDLPGFSANRISFVDGLPLIPISIALFHLLVQWEKTQIGSRERQCTFDIITILTSSYMDALIIQRPWREPGLFNAEMQRSLTDVVLRYCHTFPETATSFHRLGLPMNLHCEPAARAIISALKKIGVVGAIRGTLACRLYSDSARNPRVCDNISNLCSCLLTPLINNRTLTFSFGRLTHDVWT